MKSSSCDMSGELLGDIDLLQQGQAANRCRFSKSPQTAHKTVHKTEKRFLTLENSG